MKKPGLHYVVACFLVLLVTSIAARYVNHSTTVLDGVIIGDAQEYASTAINIAFNGVFADQAGDGGEPLEITRLPGYPMVLAIVYRFSADPVAAYKTAVVLNSFFGVATVLLFYIFCLRFFSVAAAFACAFLVAINPHMLVIEYYLLTEAFFALQLILLLFLLSGEQSQLRRTGYFLAGGMAAYASLTRPSFLAFLPFIIVFVLAFNVLWRQEGKRFFALIMAGFLLVLSPWYLYTSSHGIPFSGSKNHTVTLAGGFFPGLVYENEEFYGWPYMDPETPQEMYTSNMAAVRQLGEWVKEDPVRYFAWFLVGKPLTLWQWETIQGTGEIFIYPVSGSAFQDNKLFVAIRAIYKAMHPFMVAFMLLGIIFALVRRDSTPVMLASCILLYFFAIHIAYMSVPRFSIPLRPLMIFLDAYAIQCLVNYYRDYKKTASEAAGAG